MLEDLKTFCRRINARLEDATFEEKQAILQLLIERIIVGEDTLEIRHVIPLDGPPRRLEGFYGTARIRIAFGWCAPGTSATRLPAKPPRWHL